MNGDALPEAACLAHARARALPFNPDPPARSRVSFLRTPKWLCFWLCPAVWLAASARPSSSHREPALPAVGWGACQTPGLAARSSQCSSQHCSASCQEHTNSSHCCEGFVWPGSTVGDPLLPCSLGKFHFLAGQDHVFFFGSPSPTVSRPLQGGVFSPLLRTCRCHLDLLIGHSFLFHCLLLLIVYGCPCLPSATFLPDPSNYS